MVIYCSVPQCSSSLKTKNEFKFHNYPKDEKTKKRWLVAVRSGKNLQYFQKFAPSTSRIPIIENHYQVDSH